MTSPKHTWGTPTTAVHFASWAKYTRWPSHTALSLSSVGLERLVPCRTAQSRSRARGTRWVRWTQSVSCRDALLAGFVTRSKDAQVLHTPPNPPGSFPDFWVRGSFVRFCFSIDDSLYYTPQERLVLLCRERKARILQHRPCDFLFKQRRPSPFWTNTGRRLEPEVRKRVHAHQRPAGDELGWYSRFRNMRSRQ